MVCGAIGHHSNSLLLSTISVALATGFGAAALIYCFGAVSGSHAFFYSCKFQLLRDEKLNFSIGISFFDLDLCIIEGFD